MTEKLPQDFNEEQEQTDSKWDSLYDGLDNTGQFNADEILEKIGPPPSETLLWSSRKSRREYMRRKMGEIQKSADQRKSDKMNSILEQKQREVGRLIAWLDDAQEK